MTGIGLKSLKSKWFTGWTSSSAKHGIASRLIAGARWALLGEVGARALTFVASAAIARLLNLHDFGGYSLIQGCIAMFMTFAAFGMGHTTGRYVAALRSESPQRIPSLITLTLSFSIVSGGIAVSVLWILSPFLASTVLNAPELSLPLRMAAPALIFSSLAGTLNGVTAGFESFNRLATQEWSVSVATFIAVVSGALSAGLAGAALGLSIGEAVRVVLAARSAHSLLKTNDIRLFAWGSAVETKVLWTFSLPTVISGVLHVPVFWWCQAIIVAGPTGLAQVGIYNAAQKWMTLVIFVPTAASAIVGPVLSSLSGDKSTHRATTLAVAAAQTATCAIPAVLVAIFAGLAMSVFGPEFTVGAPTLVLMMVLAPVSMAIRLAWSSLLSLERAWSACIIWLIWSVLALALTWWWQGSGAYGLASAMLIAYSVALVLYVVTLLSVWRE